MSNCGSYGDDLVLEYKVPIRTNVNVQSGTITSRSSGLPETGTKSCNSCPSTFGYNGTLNTRSQNLNSDYPTCTEERRGNTRYRTCYYSNGSTTVETFPA